MGYFLMPEAEDRTINVRLVVAEAIRVFAKSRKIVADTKFRADVDLSRNVVTLYDDTTGDRETYTFVELGFL